MGLPARGGVARDAAILSSGAAGERTASLVTLNCVLPPGLLVVVSMPGEWPYLSVRPLDHRSLRRNSLTMDVSSGSRAVTLLRARVVRLQSSIQPCLAIEVNSSSGLLGSLLVLQLVRRLLLGLVPHRLCPALNVVVIGIVLVFKLLRLSVLGVKGGGADSCLELVVDLWGTVLARRLMVVEPAVRPGAWLRGG